ncbi:MAG: sigma-70 family RNA polymerase sigma factor [Bacteroidetes bacterium]|nr:sigma-70 family RNA polymerase sigma factor [Bacteroidota bacterium]
MDYRYSNDEKLWNDFRSGNKSAFEYIYRTYTGILYNYGFKICQNTMLTKDAIQDVFFTLLDRHEKLKLTDSIKLYLFKSLRLEIFKRLKVEQRFSDTSPEDTDFNLEYSAEEKMIEDEITMIRIRELAHVIEDLPRRQKESVYLRFYEGMSYQEIAEIMEIDVSSAYKMLYKAIEKLYENLAMKNGNLFL